MKLITAAFIKIFRPCSGGMELFNKLFPDGMPVDEENATKASFGELPCAWLFGRLLETRSKRITISKAGKRVMKEYCDMVDRHDNDCCLGAFLKTEGWKAALAKEVPLLVKALKSIKYTSNKKKR